MCLAVSADNSRPVDGENDRELLQTYVRDNLVIGPLQEGGIDRHHRFHAAGRKSRRKSNSMLLGDSHIKKTVGVTGVETLQSHAVLHGSRNADQPCLF